MDIIKPYAIYMAASVSLYVVFEMFLRLIRKTVASFIGKNISLI